MPRNIPPQPLAVASFLTGGGEMGALMRTHDWSGSPLGSPSAWPQSLRSVVSLLLLGSQFPMFVAWGPELGFLYNDPYRVILGDKHPASLGARFADIWSEIWDDIGPLIDAALNGEATYREDLPLLMNRKGFDEQTWFTFSYSPVRDESGQVAGMFCACSETTEKVLAQRRLAGESERLREMFQQAPGFMAMLRGRRHVFELANAAYTQLVGRDVVGRSVREALPEVEGQGFFQLLDQVYATGEPATLRSAPARLASGAAGAMELRYLDLIYQPIRGTDGTVDGIFVEGSDVTERVLAEEALRESEAFTRRILESSGDCIKVLDLQGRLEFMSAGGMCTMEVDDFAALRGKRWADFWSGDGSARVHAAIADALTGGTGRFQGQAPTLKGNMRHWDVVVTPVPGPDGRPEKLLSISRDVTEQHRVEQALQELNATLEARVQERTRERDRTWQLSQDLLVVADGKGVIRAINRRWAEVLGWDEQALVGRSFVEFIHPDDVDQTLAAFGGIFKRPFTEPYPYRFRHRDGSYRWIAWTGAYEAGNVYANGRDITAEREQAAALAQAEETLRQSQKMEAVGQLTGGIAHDFNNMLAVVMGSLDLLGRRLGMADTRARHYLNAATDGARRAASLTQRLLAFSRQQPLHPTPIDVNKLVAGMSDLLRHSLSGQVQLETVLAGGLWRAHADPNQLENAVLNLAVNARDAMPEDGRLTIETQNAHLDGRYVSSQIGVPAGQYVLIAVTDTGTGMPEEVIAKAFDPFFTTKGVGKGTGLGLSQVYGFVRQSGGHVKIYSEIGHGTTVKIYLPRLLGEAGGTAVDEGPSRTLLGEPQEVVLVVEDEPSVRQFSVDALGELGYRVLEADSASMALRLLETHPEIALLFTDVVMPETNGAQLAEQARRLRPDLKVLFTTGYSRNAVVHNGVLDAGVELLGKPFTIDELAAKVRAMLDAIGAGAGEGAAGGH